MYQWGHLQQDRTACKDEVQADQRLVWRGWRADYEGVRHITTTGATTVTWVTEVHVVTDDLNQCMEAAALRQKTVVVMANEIRLSLTQALVHGRNSMQKRDITVQ